jgi:hypothetical protein
MSLSDFGASELLGVHRRPVLVVLLRAAISLDRSEPPIHADRHRLEMSLSDFGASELPGVHRRHALVVLLRAAISLDRAEPPIHADLLRAMRARRDGRA